LCGRKSGPGIGEKAGPGIGEKAGPGIGNVNIGNVNTVIGNVNIGNVNIGIGEKAGPLDAQCNCKCTQCCARR